MKLMQTYCFSLKLHPIVVALISGSGLQQLLLWCYNGDSLFPSSLLHLLFGIPLKKICTLSHIYSLIQLFIYIKTNKYLFYSLGYKTIILFVKFKFF